MRQGNLYTLLGFIPILAIAFTQVLLSWRGGIVYMFIIVFFIFWNNKIQYDVKKIRPLIWVVCLIMLVPIFIQLGNSIRSERLGGESNFAESKLQFVLNILNRSQGSTRLAVVVNDIGTLSFTNGFKIKDLIDSGKTTTRYIDEKLYGVLPHQSHSVGTSGPGGAYVAMGLSGVLMSYFLFGGFYRSGYECVKNSNKDNVLGVVWYAVMALVLFDNMSENFNITYIKLITALSILFFIVSRMFVSKVDSNANR